MAPRRLHHLLQLLCLAVAVTAACGSAGFRAELNHPYTGSPMSSHDMIRHAARASKARLARLDASLLARLRGNMPAAGVPIAALSDQGYTVTVGIGTPAQRSTLVMDTGSDLTWTQCKLLNVTERQRQPLYDPGESSSFAFLPCSSSLCTEGYPGTKSCSNNSRCVFAYRYGSAAADGVLASEAFSFGGRDKLALTFGCAALTSGTILGASGILGLSSAKTSLISQLKVPRFSYCFTPFSDRKTSKLFFGARAEFHKYNTTGKIQNMSFLKNPTPELDGFFYYVPMVGLSLGTRRLPVPARSLAISKDGTGGTIVDSGSTLMSLAEPAFKEVKNAVLKTLKLPVANRTVEDYKLCFHLPSGVPMDAVEIPPLVLHFTGGAEMILQRDSYFQEPRVGLMCLAVSTGFSMSIIGNVQQQNLQVLFDVKNKMFSFAATQCDRM